MKSADVFLSYSSADTEHLDALVAALQGAEIQVWYDEGGRHGPRYQRQIEDTIKGSKVFVLLWSRRALGDARVQAQLAQARALGRPVQAYCIEDLGAGDASSDALEELDTIEAFGAHQSSALEKLLDALREAGVQRHSPEVFISYSSKDGERVHRIAQHLRDARLSVWIDRAKMKTGADWDKQIVQALKSCKIVIFVRTENSLRSGPVATELKLAKDLDKRILQLRLSGPPEVPDDFAFLLARDNYLEAEGKRDDVVLEELLRELKNLDQEIDSDSRAVDALRDEAKSRRRARLRRHAVTVLPALLAVVAAYRWWPTDVWAGESVLLPSPAAVLRPAERANRAERVIEYWRLSDRTPTDANAPGPTHLPAEEFIDSVPVGLADLEGQGPRHFPLHLRTESAAEAPATSGAARTTKLLKRMRLEARLFEDDELMGRYGFELGAPVEAEPQWDRSRAILLRLPLLADVGDETLIELQVREPTSGSWAALGEPFATNGRRAVILGRSRAGMAQRRSDWISYLRTLDTPDSRTLEVVGEWMDPFVYDYVGSVSGRELRAVLKRADGTEGSAEDKRYATVFTGLLPRTESAFTDLLLSDI